MRLTIVTVIALTAMIALAGGGVAVAEGLSASEVVTEVPFDYEKDGRDIFTYREPDPSAVWPPERPPVIPYPPGEEEKAKARPDYATAERLFAEGRFEDALMACSGAAADAMRMKKPALVERIEVLSRAAETMERRRGAEARFAKLGLKVQGILIDGTSSAVVDGAALKEGDTIGDTGARIVRIERDGIVVLYEGFMVRGRMAREEAERR